MIDKTVSAAKALSALREGGRIMLGAFGDHVVALEPLTPDYGV